MYPPEDRSSNNKFEATTHSELATPPPTDYDPQDFSQSGINKGQRKINYALTVVDLKLLKAIEELRDAIVAFPPTHKIDLEDLNEAIKDVYQTSKKVADIKPPGCDTTWN